MSEDLMTEFGVQEIPVSMIRLAKDSLRDAQRENESFGELVDSIRTHGLLNPIVVYHVADDEDEHFVLVDGTQRFAGCCDAGLEIIPANVIQNRGEADMLRKQIVGNIHRIETKPVEYSKQLQKILSLDPVLTVNQLANQLNKSSAWIGQRLGLLKLDKSVAELVDDGKINLSNAYALAKLPIEEQINHVEAAMTKTPGDFVPEISERKRELDKARREGRTASDEYIPVPRYQKLTVAKAEVEDPKLAPVLCKRHGCETPADGFTLGVKWCMQIDPDSVAVGKEKHDAKMLAIQERREKAKASRLEKRQKEAEIKAERIRIEAEAIRDGKSEDEIKAILADFDTQYKESRAEAETETEE
jgi:ParB/RepB/Spo0J family partition protein